MEDLTRLQILIAYWGFGLHWGTSTLRRSCSTCEAWIILKLVAGKQADINSAD